MSSIADILERLRQEVDPRDPIAAIHAELEAALCGGLQKALDVLDRPPVASARFTISAHPITGPLPWAMLDAATQDSFRMHGTAAVTQEYRHDNTLIAATERPAHDTTTVARVWSATELDAAVAAAVQGVLLSPYGARASSDMYAALAAHPVRGKRVLVVGSQQPWVEAMLLAGGAEHVTTVDFNPPHIPSAYKALTSMSVEALDSSTATFDAIVSFSSLEHDGLGRYGDPIDPDADLKRVARLPGLLTPGGLLYLAVPVGADAVVYNSHRIYGPIRLARLHDGWRRLGVYAGYDDSPDSDYWRTPDARNQPVYVLEALHTPTPDADAILNFLTPHSIDALDMERWGPAHDGGYVVPGNIARQVRHVVTVGVGDDVSFEADFARRVPDARFTFFDHTVQALPLVAEPLAAVARFHRLGLGAACNGDIITLARAWELADPGGGPVLLKMDAEGAEWECLTGPLPAFDNVSLLLLEIHHLADKARWPVYRACLDRLAPHFVCVHTHGNNTNALVDVMKYAQAGTICNVIELTFVNRNVLAPRPWKWAQTPTPLDGANIPGIPDVVMRYW